MVLSPPAATLAVMLAAAQAQPSTPRCGDSQTRLELRVEGLRSAAGLVTVVVYGDRPEDFLVKGRRLVKARLKAAESRVTACLPMPHPGTYALAAYHDEDGDGKFDRSLVGLPTEGFAFSNDPPTIAGLPSFNA
ncbi:MAG TPA: DUF2141 domain-containing protein, partial [Candidatus Omnitrophota bacterium]|nr:DUF2141 domain-containing protein [Candidatus Omnitrophota bacterium]